MSERLMEEQETRISNFQIFFIRRIIRKSLIHFIHGIVEVFLDVLLKFYSFFEPFDQILQFRVLHCQKLYISPFFFARSPQLNMTEQCIPHHRNFFWYMLTLFDFLNELSCANLHVIFRQNLNSSTGASHSFSPSSAPLR